MPRVVPWWDRIGGRPPRSNTRARCLQGKSSTVMRQDRALELMREESAVALARCFLREVSPLADFTPRHVCRYITYPHTPRMITPTRLGDWVFWLLNVVSITAGASSCTESVSSAQPGH